MTEDCQHVWKITEATQEHVTRECILCHTSDTFPATLDFLLPYYIEAEQLLLLRYQELAQAEDQGEEWLDQANLRELNIQDALDSSLALLLQDAQQMAEARALLDEAESLLSGDDGDFSAWLNDYTAFTAKYPQETSE